MVCRCHWASLALLLVGGWALTAVAAAVAPEINDQGKFFSAEAVKTANERIRAIASKYDQDVLIETFASPGGDQADKVKGLDAKAKEEFFNKWAKERADHCVVRGVYLLICREPQYFFVGVTKHGHTAFPPDVRQQLRKAMVVDFGKSRFDEGLAAGLSFIEDRLAKAK